MEKHDFTTDEGENKYYRTVFCRKCGQVAWFYNWSPEKNIAELQSRLKECITP